MVASCDPTTLFSHVEDLSRYPPWMALVREVESVDDGEDRPTWSVELRAQVGPLARSKRLRMVRTHHDPPRSVVFERDEVDGRDHAEWVLRAEVAPVDDGAELMMTLRYGGALWSGAVLGRILDDEVRSGSERLRDLVADDAAG